jgi:glycosyltransferase involved in cell wall biosynthesis
MTTRILFVAKTREYGGTERHLEELIQRLQDPAIHSTIRCYGPDFYSKRFEVQPNVSVVEETEPQSLLRYWLSFVKARPDTIVLVKGWSEEFPLRTYMAARLSGAKRLVAIEHLLADSAPPDEPGHGFRSYLRKVFGWRRRFLFVKRLQGLFCTATICVSQAVRNRLIEDYRYPTHNTVAILNGVDLKRFNAERPAVRQNFRDGFGVRSDEAVLVCASRLSERKRIDVLLEALAKVAKDRSDWKCWILGGGPLEQELRAQTSRLGLDGQVRFFGFQEDIASFLKAGDIYVSSSEKEGFGLSLVEAMACKLPCIATDIPGHDEVVVHGYSGWLVPRGASERLAESITRLLGDREERSRMGENGRARVEEYFDINESMAKIGSVLLGRSLP